MADHHEAHDTHETHGHDSHAAPQTPLQDNAAVAAGVLLVTLFTLALVWAVITMRQPLDETARADNTTAASTEQTVDEGTGESVGETPDESAPETAFVAGEFDVALAYAVSCAGCHGMDGKGVPELANSTLEGSDLLNPDNRAAFFTFLTESRPMPVDASEFYHPIRGEYPGYTDEQLEAIIDYVYTLN